MSLQNISDKKFLPGASQLSTFSTYRFNIFLIKKSSNILQTQTESVSGNHSSSSYKKDGILEYDCCKSWYFSMMRCIKIIEQIWEKTQFKYLDKGVDILVYIIADTKRSIKPLKTGIAIDDKSSSALICI